MSIEEAEKVAELLNKHKELFKMACDYQELIHGANEFTITTKKGSITISSEGHSSFGNRVLFDIDVLFGGYLDKFEAELKEL